METFLSARLEWRAGVIAALAAVCALVQACSEEPLLRSPMVDAHVGLDGASAGDVGVDGGRDAAEADAWASDAYVASLSDACVECVAADPCRPSTGCEPTCETTTLPDGAGCGVGGSCLDGSCLMSSGICGDGFVSRKLGESCDDMNLDAGDACSPECLATTLEVAFTEGMTDTPSAQMPAVAADGLGDLLFVWLATRRGADGENFRQLLARRYNGAGVARDVEPLILEDTMPVSQPVVPSVAGQASGWVVTWRSQEVEGADGDVAGIAYRLITHDGVFRSRRQANTVELFDQREPVVVALSSGFVIVWSDQSVEISRGNLRMRAFDTTGAAVTDELPAATTTAMNQSRPFAAARGAAGALGTNWSVVFSDTSSGTTMVRMRRFDGTTALDASDFLVAHTPSSQPTLALTSDAAYVAWSSLNDVFVRRIADGVVPVDDADVDMYSTEPSVGMPVPIDELPAVAAFPRDGSEGYVVAWYSNSRLTGPAGYHLGAPATVTLPAAAADLSALIGSRATALSVAPTNRGLWFTWADAMVATPATVAAYLLPWD